ncbi:MAG: 30S ribosomal protein S13 [Candidatus Yanofskybacteria bacterium RIFCSPLOWO2_01_FULL_49_25]|uniref:Small ribosomal subunit protein uS13 n=1 Tax=Candidatus Yanofskybacteria bacterium RIFCSPLOWO2_01_FULL_49_25 TaxID=1802701 RepID=A0A1F8GS39_9BACT|nr:MAG: 30S ribosomal protein S13 [Candidatus Yanofskybacteria bacterium RIFCSPLOWO2_01_FULL_49_25]
MARISGIVLPDNKKILFSLQYIFGIGSHTAALVLKEAHVSVDKATKELTAEEINKIQTAIDKTHKVEGDLRRDISQNIKRLKEIGAWRGTRHARRLPIHGRTKTNSRTTRGNVRKTMGSGRKPAGQKT